MFISVWRRARTAIPIRKYGTRPEHCDAHMNELPIPCGPWEPWYKAKQTAYNAIFLGGLAWLLFSFGLCIYTDSIYLNFFPPALPGPPSESEDCEDP